ncbi:pentapeptide repeat-containing protein [Sulfurimonas sp. MAG313]|nr:ion channel [Sulfurimonas sp. MAG313]MDF1881807.1 pentapeptide repeat-containing protein [Sulfurimonas sp. MAG313]
MSCSYISKDGNNCINKIDDNSLCYWHNPKADKANAFVKEELEKYLETSSNLEGFQLSHADLHGIKLMVKGKKEGVNLSYADLYHADLSNSHLFHINLSYTSLMKADLSEANLNLGNLENCNMLGTIFSHTKIEHVYWGKNIVQEREAFKEYKAKHLEQSADFFEQGEEVYRNLRKLSESRGHFEHAGYFFHKEMVMRRYQMKPFSFERSISTMVDLFCGYGEKPINVIFFSLSIILTSAVLFFFVGIQNAGEFAAFNISHPLMINVMHFFNALYFSVVTFTTLGYGDISPLGFSRLIAATEAFIGSFTLALFVVVFVKKMTR